MRVRLGDRDFTFDQEIAACALSSCTLPTERITSRSSLGRHLLSRRPAFPFLRRQRLDIELIAGAGISVSTHAADGIHELLVDMKVGRVDSITANEDANDFSENDSRAGPTWRVVKLNGPALGVPSLLTVVTSAIGRGMTVPIRIL
ncbi:hypothetical protein JZX86_03035 [Agrobacterium rosae]|nr:hypothetical protein [Agrobacterium rosae]